jgi:hypothetical protein
MLGAETGRISRIFLCTRLIKGNKAYWSVIEARVVRKIGRVN